MRGMAPMCVAAAMAVSGAALPTWSGPVSPASAAAGSEPTTTMPGAATLRIQMVTGEAVTGCVQGWRVDTGVVIVPRDGDERLVRTVDIVQVTPEESMPGGRASRRAGAQGSWVLQTTNGEWLPVEIVGGDETSVRIRHSEFGALRVGLDRIRSIERTGQDERHDDRAAASTEDCIDLANGDRVSGLIDRIDAKGVSLQTGDRRQMLAWAAVQSLRMAEANLSRGAPGVRFRVTMADGTTVVGTALEWGRETIRIVREDEQSAPLAVRDVGRIEVTGGRWQWLSELPCEAYESIPYLGRRWPMARDRSVVGSALMCAGRRYPRGIGLHSAARAVWALEGQYARFVTAVAIDDSGGSWSDVQVEVRVDERSVVRHEHIRHGESPRPIDIDVTGAKRLEIVVGFGDNGDVQDRVNLLDAALVRPPT